MEASCRGGIVGGAASSVQGGKFSHGFVSAGASSIGGNAGSPTGNILMSAMVGGTVSHLVGGKFANGAISAGFSAIMSQAIRNNTNGIGGRSKSIIFDTQSMAGESRDLYDGKVKVSRWGSDNTVSDSDLKSVETALENIFETEVGSSILEDLTIDKPLKIILNQANEVAARLNQRVITIDLNSNFRYFDQSRPNLGLRRFSLERLLSHEIGHAVYNKKMVDGAQGAVWYADSIMREINGTIRGDMRNICRIQEDGNCL